MKRVFGSNMLNIFPDRIAVIMILGELGKVLGSSRSQKAQNTREASLDNILFVQPTILFVYE